MIAIKKGCRGAPNGTFHDFVEPPVFHEVGCVTFSVRNMEYLKRAVVAVTVLMAGAAAAAECPGNPNAIGTSRTVVVDPVEHPRLGVMQYHESLPLQDHEVVLTFDDGPLPPRTMASAPLESGAPADAAAPQSPRPRSWRPGIR